MNSAVMNAEGKRFIFEGHQREKGMGESGCISYMKVFQFFSLMRECLKLIDQWVVFRRGIVNVIQSYKFPVLLTGE